ncbi:MAG: tyrosine-type recombinase/integrase [Pirellulales bacterium]
MSDEIKVHVVKYPDRKNLVMRYVDPYTGRQVQRSTGTDNEKEALKEAAKWEDDLHNGRYKAPSRVTWEEFTKKYLSEVASGLADGTQIRIEGIFDAIEEHINPERVRDITPERLSVYVKKLRKAGLKESTIASHLAHLRASLSYAVEWGYLASMPKLPRQHRVRRATTMKGRPITTEEYERMLDAAEAVVGVDAAPSWKRLINGLWFSGLRLSEAIALYWSRDDCPAGKCLEVDMSGKRPMLRIPADLDKGNRDRVLPMAPEFAEFLMATPEEERTGAVFHLTRRRKRYEGEIRLIQVSSVISAIGKKAGVKVNADTGKTASAHDLRRAFGQRWAARVMPQILMQLMRHEDISTTMKFYVGREAEATADVLYAAIKKEGTISGTNERESVKN